jgi:hypothetical protein
MAAEITITIRIAPEGGAISLVQEAGAGMAVPPPPAWPAAEAAAEAGIPPPPPAPGETAGPGLALPPVPDAGPEVPPPPEA